MDPSLQGNLTGPGGPPAQPPPSSPFLPLASILPGRRILQVGSPSTGRQDAGGERQAGGWSLETAALGRRKASGGPGCGAAAAAAFR